MKSKIRYILYLVALILSSCISVKQARVLPYVNTLIGTAKADVTKLTNSEGHGQTIPAVTAPFGMTNWVPQTRHTAKKCVAPFYYEDKKISGFRATHWTSGSCMIDYGSFTMMPLSGKNEFLPEKRGQSFQIDSASMSPAYIAVNIPELKINTELTATKRCGIFRFSWENRDNPQLAIDVNNDFDEGFIKIDTENQEIIASNPVRRIYSGWGKPAGFSGYMVVKFDCEFESLGTYSGEEIFLSRNSLTDKPNMGGLIKFKLPKNGIVHAKVGTSFTSIENAKKNLFAEIPSWNFEQIKRALETEWEKLLGQIRVETKSETDKTIFYTAIYHSCLHPRLFNDVDGSYIGFASNGKVYYAKSRNQYMDFSAWDTYRALMPLLSLIAPEEYEDMLHSLVNMAEQGGWMPIFPMWNSYTSAMIGDHCGAIIGDGYLKGFNVDIDRAWHYLRQNAYEIPADSNEYNEGKGRRALRSYIQYGYIPLEDKVENAFHKQEQVSRTLEYAYDDWVLAQVAKKLNKKEDFSDLSARALNYKNVYDTRKGWVCGRFEDGRFTDKFTADNFMPFITEGTPMHYTWYVPHDTEGLIKLMGGETNYLSKLVKFIDGGKYWHGNEPSHHIPYMFNAVGRWDLTQKTVKNIIENEYSSTPGGISGNDDAGQMSAWYVFSALGLYPMCPGSNEYQLSSPIFDKVTFKLNKTYYPGKAFYFETKNNEKNKIFNDATLNGRKVTSIGHDEIRKGGKLYFH